ncbi:ribosomal protein S18 acetylase RimI-like enzyme [Kribbella aluminosa]|uniref:Ribosomal protein S18 acetylase RimI-like enzyme n=1 Tax=Kribbella aluminosa TaxID=416017 RepID=A0ABS4UPP7_9ACTN|nr:GNAT family N-acetyltransferase [Kribbella aluminosa]MBP2353617.1 ribosomal protein S18 acetylase RimI-like enzyme [Kribbella aluminosa]
MSAAEYPEWKDHLATSFAAAMGAANGLAADEALKASYQETEKLLPDGPDTEHQLIWVAFADDVPVGTLWISTRSRLPFVYSIEVSPDHRRKGYGGAIMLAGEEECRRRGHDELELNVFGDNPSAIALYNSLGYAVTSQQMRKSL